MMKQVGSSLLTSFLKGLIIFYIAYMILGAAALYAMIGSIGIIEYIKTGQSALIFDLENLEINEFLSLMGGGIYDSLPFARLIKPFLGEYDAIIPSLAEFFKNITSSDLTAVWDNYQPYLWRDLAISVLAHCILFTCTRLKSALGCYSNFIMTLALTITTVLWSCASFCISSCLITVLESAVDVSSYETMYFLLTAIVCGIHSVSLFVKNKESKFRVTMILGMGAIFNTVRILFLWIWLEGVGEFFKTNSFSIEKNPIVTALFVGIVFCVLESLEAYTLKALKESN